jgi:hypothetical protein
MSEEMYAKLQTIGINTKLLKECSLTNEELQDFAKIIEDLLGGKETAESI